MKTIGRNAILVCCGITTILCAQNTGMYLYLTGDAQLSGMASRGVALKPCNPASAVNPALLQTGDRKDVGLQPLSATFAFVDPLSHRLGTFFSYVGAASYQFGTPRSCAAGLSFRGTHRPELGTYELPVMEQVVTASFGVDPSAGQDRKRLVGFALKYLASIGVEFGDSSGEKQFDQNVLFDLGYRRKLGNSFFLGAHVGNCGPRPAPDHAVPFILNFGIGTIQHVQRKNAWRISAEMGVNRVFIHHDRFVTEKGDIVLRADPFYKALITDTQDKSLLDNFRSCMYSAGGEVTINERFYFRTGTFIYYTDGLFEQRYGFGVNLVNAVNVDLSFLSGLPPAYEPYTYSVEGGTLSLTITWLKVPRLSRSTASGR